VKRIALLSLIVATVGVGCSGTDARIVVAAGTTLVDSGFIEAVLADYPGEVEASVIGVSSREAFALGSAGSAQVLITHLAEVEEEFLLEQPGAVQELIFTSQFVVVGPETGPLGQDATPPDAARAFALIAAAEHPFVSRGDGSGTAAKEREIWALAGIDPTEQPWYAETGQGMGFTLQVADQRGAYTLAELGTFVSVEAITLTPFVGGDEDEQLENPYRITLVEGASAASRDLFEWLTSDEGADAMSSANLELFDRAMYVPAAMAMGSR